MKKDVKVNVGIQLLLKKYRDIFQIAESLNYHSETDYKTAEGKSLKYALLAGLKSPLRHEKG
jgi:hypothetical protein